jgi:hypothetical protein
MKVIRQGKHFWASFLLFKPYPQFQSLREYDMVILYEYFNRHSFFFAVWFEDYPGGHLSRPRVQASRAPGSGKYIFRWKWAESNIPGVHQVTAKMAGGRTKRSTSEIYFIYTGWEPGALNESLGVVRNRQCRIVPLVSLCSTCQREKV